GHCSVELLAGWQRSRKRSVTPSAAADPRAVRMRCRERANCRLQRLEILSALEAEVVHVETAVQDVRVHIVEARHDRRSMRIDDFGRRTSKLLDRLAGPDRNDSVAAHRNSLLKA